MAKASVSKRAPKAEAKRKMAEREVRAKLDHIESNLDQIEAKIDSYVTDMAEWICRVEPCRRCQPFFFFCGGPSDELARQYAAHKAGEPGAKEAFERALRPAMDADRFFRAGRDLMFPGPGHDHPAVPEGLESMLKAAVLGHSHAALVIAAAYAPQEMDLSLICEPYMDATLSGWPKSPELAKAWFELAVELGSRCARAFHGWALLQEGRRDEARVILEMAAAEKCGAGVKGLLELTGRESPQCVKRLAELVELREPEAAVELAVKYAKGQGVEKNSLKAALWAKKALELGFEGKEKLWLEIRSLELTDTNSPQHVEGLKRQAELGHASAASALAVRYASGIKGVKKDVIQASAWARQALKLGFEGKGKRWLEKVSTWDGAQG